MSTPALLPFEVVQTGYRAVESTSASKLTTPALVQHSGFYSRGIQVIPCIVICDRCQAQDRDTFKKETLIVRELRYSTVIAIREVVTAALVRPYEQLMTIQHTYQ